MKPAETTTPAPCTRRAAGAALFGALALLAAGPAAANDAWPSKPVKIIVPFAAGVSPDVVTRLLAEPLARALGQPVLVDNRVGAAGIIGAEAAAKSPADGYTFLMSVNSIMGINPNVYKRLPYDTFRDFTPVTQVVLVPYVLVTSTNSPYHTLQDVIADARARPRGINYGSVGVASGPHVIMEMLNNMAGTQMTHVPYKGSPLADLLAGQIPLTFDPTTTAVPMVRSGKLRALAVTSKTRNPSLPDTPAVAELLPGYDGDGWMGIYAPTGTPPAIVAKFNAAIAQVLRAPEIQSRLGDLGLQPVGNSVEAFSRVSKDEVDKWARIARANHISAD